MRGAVWLAALGAAVALVIFYWLHPVGTLFKSSGWRRPTHPAERPWLGLSSAAETVPLDQLERLVIAGVNDERLRRGGGPVQAEGILREIARRHSRSMLEKGFFAHVDPDGATPYDRVVGLCPRPINAVGENIWMSVGYETGDAASLAARILSDWMHSSGHRANILSKEFTHLGVGIIQNGNKVMATQVFARFAP